MSGLGAMWENSGDLYVGRDGSGTLTIADGGVVRLGAAGGATAHVGLNAGATGVLAIGAAAGDAAVGAGTLEAGEVRFGAGSGSLVFNHTDDDYVFAPLITGAGAVTHHAGTTILTADNSYTGDTTVHGGTLVVEGASDQGAGDYYVGRLNGDNGALIIRNGGTLASQIGYLGHDAGATGTATVTGAGSSWSSATLNLFVGNFGSGTLNITDGGQVSGAVGYIGRQTGSTGAVTVSGVNAGTGVASRWNAGGLIVGFDGTGTLDVTDGGQVLTQSGGYVGYNAAGQATVTGEGSLWDGDDLLTVGHNAAGVLTVASGGDVISSDAVIGSGVGSDGEATVTGAGSSWASAGMFIVGYNGNGVLTITDEGRIASPVIDLGNLSGSTGVLNIGAAAGDAAAAAGTLEAGEVRFGAGSSTLVFNHTDTDYVFAPLITGTGGVSHHAGTTILTADNSWNGLTAVHGGTLVIEGASDQAAGAYHIGQLAGDDGALTLRAGGTIDSGGVTIGTDSGASGAVTVTGPGSAWDASGNHFRVGDYGAGVLTLADGGSVSSYYGTVGLRAGGSGEATVTGAGSVWTVTSEFGVGSAGDGALTISDGGSITAGQGVIGGLTGAAGDVTVTGVGSSWANSGTLYVAYGGEAALTVSDGATVSNATGYVGHQAGSAGEATVTGPGSVWANTNGLIVGYDGEATLAIADGGRVSNTIAYLGNAAGSRGAATVTGADSLWDSSQDLYVGRYGEGALTLADQGVARVGGGTGIAYVGHATGSFGALIIGAAAGDAAAAAGTLAAAEVRFGGGTGALVFNHTETDYDFDSFITGAGQIDVLAGLTTLTGGNTAFTGDTTVAGGDLRIVDVLGGDVTVSGGSLGGPGAVLGAVSVGAGSLVGEAGSVLTMGSLSLGSTSVLDVTLGAPDAAALFDVTGDLTLDGTLDITDEGDFGAGVYGLITYGGALADIGLEMGDLPTGYSASLFQVQTSVAGQVNLVNAGLADLLFWDGGNPLNADNGVIDGGDGTWTLTSETWTDIDGTANGAMMPLPGLAVFMGTGGAVILDDSAGALSATGLQFASDGYVLTGDSLTLVEESPSSGVNLRVGDGTATGADWTAIVGSDLTGATDVAKTDRGTLILTGTNSWTGTTSVHHGALVFDGGAHAGTAYNVGRVNGDHGFLVVRDGGSVSNSDSFIGLDAGAAGSATVTGAGSQWTSNNQLAVGLNGVGTLAVADGGVVDSGWAGVGVNAGGQGEVTVSGAGSRWDASGPIHVGAFGSGELNVLNAGAVDIGGAVFFVGTNAGAIGATTVSGAGSSVTFNQLQVGSDGQGTLQILDGADASGDLAFVGAFDGQGILTIAGAGSRLVLTGPMVTGVWGVGLTVLADGAVLDVDSYVELAREVNSVGILAIGAAETDAADAAGTLKAAEVRFGAGAGALVFNHTGTGYDFDAVLVNAGAVRQLAGVTTLTADSAGFAGLTEVEGGTLLVDGALGGTVSVSDGGTLGGSGSVGAVLMDDGAALLGRSSQTLTLGSLNLASGSTVEVALDAASSDALFDVTGDLVLDGTLTVTDAGGFGAGVYRLFDYGGDLTDHGLDIGSTPSGVADDDLLIQTAVAGQVNLVSAAGQDLLFWDGGDAALHDNGAVDGGAGTWTSGGQTWTEAAGLVTSATRPDPGFAVFTGAAGTVTVSGPDVGVTGMQFAVDGYLVEEGAVELAAAETLIRVGDGTAAGAAMTATIASALTGAGQLVKTDLGTLILTSANSYGGGVEVRDGTLIGDTDSLVGDLVNDATLVFDQGVDASFVGAISGDGEAFKQGAGVLTLTGANAMDWTVQTGGLTAGAAAFAGDVTVQAGASFSFDAAADAVWAGALSGSGDFNKLGAATLTLTGDSSAFDGTTTIGGGFLMVNGALGGQLLITDEGFLGGSGSLGQLTIADGATISPGNSIGTLNINGDLVLAAGSIYEVEVDPAGTASDLIAVTGTATIDGGTVRHIGLTGDYAPSSTYTILTAAGGVTGTFDAVATDFAFLDASLGYTAQAVTLTLDRNAVAFPDVGATDNQRATGAGVESTGTGAALYGAVIGLNADNARLAFEQLSGDLHGSLRSATVENSGQVRGLIGQRLRRSDADQRDVSMWVQAAGAVGHMATDGNAASLRSRAGGLWLGAEGVSAGGLTLGAAIGADRSSHDSARAGEAERDGYRLAAYGSGQWGAFGLSGGVAAAWDDVETDRTVLFPGFAEQLEADYSAETVQAFAEATWTIPAGQGVIEPFASVARVRTETDGFTETGGAGALTVESQTQEVTFATLGLGARRDFDDGQGRTGALEGRLGWRHATGDLASSTDQAFAGGAAFTVDGLPVDEDALVAEIGGAFNLGETLSLKVDWTGQAGDHTAQRLSATLSWRF